MERLNLPVIKRKLSMRRCLSMDDYLKFVTLNLKYTIDTKALRRQKKIEMVNVPFSLK